MCKAIPLISSCVTVVFTSYICVTQTGTFSRDVERWLPRVGAVGPTAWVSHLQRWQQQHCLPSIMPTDAGCYNLAVNVTDH